MEREDTELLLDSARRWFAAHAPMADRVARFRHGNLASEGAFTAMADMGWTGLSLSEAEGGFEAGWQTCFELLREAGRDARPEPLGLHLLLAPMLGPDHAEALVGGSMRLALADASSALRWRDSRLDGKAGAVLGSEGATHLLVPVAEAVWLVDLQATGVRVEPARLVDSRATAIYRFEETPASALAGNDTAREALDRGAAALVADSAGVLDAAFWLTLDYLKQRVQFGKPLSAQQAIQHRMAEVFCDLQQLLALAGRVAAELDRSAHGPWPTLAPAKAFLGRRALRAMGQLVQVSGGIAVTEEYRLSHYYRRLQVAAALFGAAETQLARIDVRAQLQSA